jgi:eukaryotic-like serine/threonine-protein kinase
VTPERWNDIKTLLDEALEVPPEERDAFLATLAGSDAELVREVKALLALETQLGSFIERPLMRLGGDGGAADRAGERLGPYRLVREIGHGGMGTVYLAERADDEFDQRVAVKILKRGLDTDEVVDRFRNERQIHAGLDHPNIARLLDGGSTADGLPYLVMEHVEGRPIDVYCREEGLGLEERLELFLAVCSAVELAHRNLVVHRDLKPTNILVAAGGVPKLLDFGIAKLLGPQDAEGMMTVAGWRFLTPEYASPEQVSGAPVTTATDVYSLGVVLYQLLADRRPYELAERSVEGLAQVLSAGDPPRPGSVAPAARAARLAGDLDTIVLMAMRREPERRYGTVEQLADDLRRHLGGMPVRAVPDTVGYRVGKFVRRHRWGVAAAAAIVSLLLAFGAVSLVLMQQARTEARRAQAVTAFLVDDVFALADPDEELGPDATVKELVERGRGLLHERLREEPVIRAELLLALGKVSKELGELDAAESMLEESLDLRTATLGPTHPSVAEAKNELAGVSVSRRSPEAMVDAERLTREALDIQRRHHAPRSPEVLEIETNLAMILNRTGKLEEADVLHEKLISDWRRNGNDEELATVLNNHGSALIRRSDYQAAVPFVAEALELRRRVYPDANSRLAATLNNLGATLDKLDRLEDARKLYAEALDISRQLHPDGHSDTVTKLINLATVHHKQGTNGEAERLLDQAQELSERVETSSEAKVAIQRHLAAVRTGLGKPALAEVAARQALERQVLEVGREHWRRYDVESVLGGALAAQGRFGAAERLLVGSYQKLDEIEGPDSSYTDQARRRLIDLYERWGKPDLAAPYREPGEEPGAVEIAEPENPNVA